VVHESPSRPSGAAVPAVPVSVAPAPASAAGPAGGVPPPAPSIASIARIDSAPFGRKLDWPAAVTSPMWERPTYPPTARATQTAIVTQRPRLPVTAAARAAITLGTLPPCPFG